METRTNENIVSSFFYYMWNKFCYEEAIKIFGQNLGDHIWVKWKHKCSQHPCSLGAAEDLFSELDTSNRAKVVNRAIECYNGMHRIKTK